MDQEYLFRSRWIRFAEGQILTLGITLQFDNFVVGFHFLFWSLYVGSNMTEED